MRNFLILFLMLFYSCSDNGNRKLPLKETIDTNAVTIDSNLTDVHPEINLDSVSVKILTDNLKIKNSDTITYTFSLDEDHSLEGNEGVAYYLDHKIIKIDLTFYGETGRTNCLYVFKKNEVDVRETVYTYKVPLFEVKDKKDIQLKNRLVYKLDVNGKVSGNTQDILLSPVLK